MQIICKYVTLTVIINKMCRLTLSLSSVIDSENMYLYLLYCGFIKFLQLSNVLKLQENTNLSKNDKNSSLNEG